jgi:hypothetical protein
MFAGVGDGTKPNLLGQTPWVNNGSATPIFVDKSMPIPKLKIGVSSRRLSYPNGRVRDLDIKIMTFTRCQETSKSIGIRHWNAGMRFSILPEM